MKSKRPITSCVGLWYHERSIRLVFAVRYWKSQNWTARNLIGCVMLLCPGFSDWPGMGLKVVDMRRKLISLLWIMLIQYIFSGMDGNCEKCWRYHTRCWSVNDTLQRMSLYHRSGLVLNGTWPSFEWGGCQMLIFTLKLVMVEVFKHWTLFESYLVMFSQVFWVWIETVRDSQSNVARLVAH